MFPLAGRFGVFLLVPGRGRHNLRRSSIVLRSRVSRGLNHQNAPCRSGLASQTV